MLTFKELKPQQLKKQHDFEGLEFETTEDIPPLEGILGQERASRAMDFGLKVEKPVITSMLPALTDRAEQLRKINSTKPRKG